MFITLNFALSAAANHSRHHPTSLAFVGIFLVLLKRPALSNVSGGGDGLLVKNGEIRCPLPDVSQKVDCYVCAAYAKHPECRPLLTIFLTIVANALLLYGLVALALFAFDRWCPAHIRDKCCPRKKRTCRSNASSNGSSDEIFPGDNAIALRNLRYTEYHRVPSAPYCIDDNGMTVY